MGKIRLLKRLWNREAGEVMNATKEQEAFAVRKGYAEPYSEKIEPKKAKVRKAPKNKAEKAEENKFVGHKNFK